MVLSRSVSRSAYCAYPYSISLYSTDPAFAPFRLCDPGKSWQEPRAMREIGFVLLTTKSAEKASPARAKSPSTRCIDRTKVREFNDSS